MSGRKNAPLAPGDRVFVAGVRSSDRADVQLHDVLAEVLRVDHQHCGCWRITCRRPGPNPNDSFQVYGADCHWPHLDRIDYVAAKQRADEAEPAETDGLFPTPERQGRMYVQQPMQDGARPVRTLVPTGGVL